MVDIDKWSDGQWQSLLIKLSMEELMLLMDETKKVNSATRAMKLLDRVQEFKVVKSFENTVSIILSQCRMKMIDAYDVKWGDNSKFREAMAIVRGIKLGMSIANTGNESGTSLEALAQSFSDM